MSQWVFQVATVTPVAVADANAMTASTYLALQGGSSTQLININEIFMGGQATVTSPSIMLLARDSTVVGTPTGLATPNGNGPQHASTAALAAVPVGAITGSVQPQRSNSVTLPKMNFSFNAFGGVVLYRFPDRAPFVILGNTASLGEASLSAFTGGTPGAMGAHIGYEPM